MFQAQLLNKQMMAQTLRVLIPAASLQGAGHSQRSKLEVPDSASTAQCHTGGERAIEVVSCWCVGKERHAADVYNKVLHLQSVIARKIVQEAVLHATLKCSNA